MRRLYTLGLMLTLGAGCGGSPCGKACRKMARCLGIETPATDGVAPGTGSGASWTCPLSDECAPKESCYGKCINAASCEAITREDAQASQDLLDCQRECDLKKYDSGSSTVDGKAGGDGSPCKRSCADRECGDDGCGGVCGICILPQVCSAAGQCVKGICTPSCTGKQCGDDGCGGTCSPGCAYPKVCNSSGQCACTPSCAGKQCGDDGCGGTCPPGCTYPKTCNSSGQCACTPSCTGRQCGSDGCGGTCPPGCVYPKTCNSSGQCACTPSCAGKECGSDGCGGTCPPGCISPETCSTAGICTGSSGCGSITYEGCCSGTMLKYCDAGVLQTYDCSINPACGWDASVDLYDCGTAGGSDPSGFYPRTCP